MVSMPSWTHSLVQGRQTKTALLWLDSGWICEIGLNHRLGLSISAHDRWLDSGDVHVCFVWYICDKQYSCAGGVSYTCYPVYPVCSGTINVWGLAVLVGTLLVSKLQINKICEATWNLYFPFFYLPLANASIQSLLETNISHYVAKTIIKEISMLINYIWETTLRR